MRTSKCGLGATVAVMAACAAATAQGASINVYSSGAALASYDESGALKPGLYAAGDNPGLPAAEPTRAIVEFSLAGLPANAVVTSATFAYYPGAVTSPFRDRLGFYGYSGNGVAEAADYGAGTLLHQNAGPMDYAVYNVIDVTGFVQGLVADGATHAGIVVRNNTTELTIVNIYTFYNPSFPERAYSAPRLSIQFEVGAAPVVPTPAAATAGAVLMGGLLAARRRASA